MSYRQVVRHIEQILNDCGDPVRFTPTGRKMLDQATGHMAIEVMKVGIRCTNDCFTLPPPVPPYAHDCPGQYVVNVIHIPPSLADAYSTGSRYTDEELAALIRTSAGLFACYLLQ